MNINLGCGDTAVENCIGVDFRKTAAVDVIHDLRIYPWPFEDEQFENAFAKDIVEHMLDVVSFIDECWRIIKSGGHLHIRTTNWETEQSYKDPTHLHYFTLESFDFFDPETFTGSKYHWYTDRKWKVRRRAISGQELVFDLQKI